MSFESDRLELALKVGAEANRQAKWQHALISYEAAAEGMPDDPRPFAGLGDTYAGMGDWARALSSYEQAARKNPGNADYLDMIAELSKMLGKDKEAARAAVLSGDLYWQAEDYAQATRRWERAAELSPDYAGAHERLARYYRRMGDDAATIRHYLAMADLLEQQNRHLAALHVCTIALQIAPDDEELWQATETAWRTAAARTDSAVHGDIAFQESRVRTGDLVGTANDLAQWQLTTAFRQGTLDVPNSQRLERNILLGQALLNEGRGRAGHAILCYEQVVAGGFREPAVFLVLGLLYRLVGRPKDATAALALAARDPFYSRAVALLER